MLLTGQKLLLTDSATRPQKRKLNVVSVDRADLALGDEADVLGLVASGGRLRIVALGGDGFDASYDLDASLWQPLKKKKPEKGVRYRNASGPIRSVVIKSGKRLLVKGKGDALDQSLASEPSVVEVELVLGARRFCLAFGGSGPFKAGKKLLRRKAADASGCPVASSPSGAFVD